MKWWQKTVVYEVYPRSFQDTDGDGIGNLKGITEHLDYLSSLGVGALWLTPVYRSPMVDNGYDIADYRSIDPLWGTMDDMKELIREAEKRNIRIVMDLVYNHTSDQHEWFKQSKQSADNAYSDWYIWRDPDENGNPPTNWRAIFGGSAWTYCPERKQYYLHTFAPQQPDLNWANPQVRKELYATAKYWLNLGVGGFRMDAIPYIRKPDVFENGTPDGKDGMVSIHTMTVNRPGILDYLHEFKDQVMQGTDAFTVGEANGVRADELKDWVGENGVFDMLFEFSHVNLEFQGAEKWCHPDPWTIADLKSALRASQKATEKNGWVPVYFENHDKPRCTDHYFSPDCDRKRAAKAMGMILYTLRGTPFLYQGQELGYGNVGWTKIEDYNDISSHAQYDFALSEGCSEEEAIACVQKYSRDSARTPMQWNASPQTGFTSGRPWLPVYEDYRECNVEKESEDPRSVLQWYRRLARLRAEHPALSDGTFSELLPDHPDIFGYRRRDDSEELMVLVNMHNVKCTYEKEEGWEVLLSDSVHEPGEMKPLEAVLLRKK